MRFWMSWMNLWHFKYSLILPSSLSSVGFVGLFDAVLLLPLVVIWHFTGIEPFEFPSNSVWTLLLVNGFIGTVLSELFWLWCVCSSVSVCFTSSCSCLRIGFCLFGKWFTKYNTHREYDFWPFLRLSAYRRFQTSLILIMWFVLTIIPGHSLIPMMAWEWGAEEQGRRGVGGGGEGVAFFILVAFPLCFLQAVSEQNYTCWES